MGFNRIKETIEGSYFSNTRLNYSTTGDGRLDSAESEASIIDHLVELFQDSDIKVDKAPPRYWYDVAFTVNGKTLYANVKATSGEGADNISSKFGLFYTLTGLLPSEVKGANINHWEPYNRKLLENLNYLSDTDYYFVVYFKDSETFLVTSLKRIQYLTPNGNNLPFQCNWSNNRAFSTRNAEDQAKFLMETYYESWVKKIGGFKPLIGWRKE